MNSEDADEISKHFAHGEILDHQGIGHETGDLGRDSTGEYYFYQTKMIVMFQCILKW